MAPDATQGRLNPRTRRRLLLGLGIAAFAIVLTGLLRLTPPMEVAEAKSYDLRAGWLADPSEADSSIVIIAVDENSLDVYGDEYGRWPWDRGAMGILLRFAAAGGARAVVFDIQFPEPFLDYPTGDTILALWMAEAGNGVVGFSMAPGDSAAAALWERNRLAEDTSGVRGATRRLLRQHAVGRVGEAFPEPVLEDMAYTEAPYLLFTRTAAALGAVNWTPGPDGVTRAQPLVLEHDDLLYPSLAMAAARLAAPDRYGEAPRWDDGGLWFGDTRVPTLDDGRMIVDWHGSYMREGERTYRVIPAFHVLDSYEAISTGYDAESHVALSDFAGKVVFIAATAVGAFETRATPVAGSDPGVMIHATMVDNLLNGDFIRRAGWPANLGLLALTALVATILAVAFESAVVGVLGTAAVLLVAGGLSTWALAHGVWLDMAAPLFGGAVAFAGAYVGNYLTEGREKQRVRSLFSQYVSPDYVSRLADDYQNVRLGGERIPVTLLFSDIRGFTSLSERLDPETVIELLNEYLDEMAEVVFRHGGTLDKFIGDAVMAFWNAPVRVADHPVRAVEAALDMLDELEALNDRWASDDAPARLAIGIGINTGEAIVGNIGSLNRKLDYTAIGDTVNLASRLEGLTKAYGSSIIVSEGTRQELPEGTYDLRPIDEVKVKGKEESVQIYELRGRKGGPPAEAVPTLPGGEPASSPSPGGDGSGGGDRPRGAGVVRSILLAVLAALSAAPASAQEKTRWTDWVYRPGAWRGGSLVEYATTDTYTDSLALVAKVELYAIAPRWRAEFGELVTPDSMAPPVVLVVDEDGAAVVLTQLGSTPLEEHRVFGDPVVELVLEHVEAGRPAPAGPARITETGPDGRLAYVIQRRPAARAEFSEGLLATGTMGRLGRSVARLGIHAIGGERDEEVVASAGARGVATVQTVDGEIQVMPDTAAIVRMSDSGINLIDLDRFLRDAGIAPIPLETPREEEGI